MKIGGFLGVFCVFAVLLGVSACGVGLAVQANAETQNKVVVIDAGHGGSDGGVCDGELKEAELTLAIAYDLKEVLESGGYKVVMTRDSEKALAEGKKADMKERAEIINKAKPIVTISVHINKYTNSTPRGVRVFYDDTERYKVQGEIMQNCINNMVNKKYSGRVDLKAYGGDYFITKCSPYPCLIVECGFLSNPTDKKLLLNPKYRYDICNAILTGINEIAGQKA